MNVNIGNPGTVSRILWHFTGGPSWNIEKNKQHKKPKPANIAFEYLINILKTKTLKLGKYAELLEITVPDFQIFNKETGEFEDAPNFKYTISSSPVCCLADVPIMHLEYIAERYGKFAIGFHRDSIINSGFNPVLYTINDKHIVKNLFRGFVNLERLSPLMLKESVANLKVKVKDVYGDKLLLHELESIFNEITTIDRDIRDALDGLSQLLAFVKIFDESEFHTVYCEREWRSIREYNFDYSDIALIVIPKKVWNKNYFTEFCDKQIDLIKIPKIIPVVPWEDIIEY